YALFDALPDLGPQVECEPAPTFDELEHDGGFAVYSAVLAGDGPGVLDVGEVRDRAWVFLDGAPVGVLARDSHERALRLPAAAGRLTVLVEDQGRVGYGPRLGEPKGLVGGVRLDGAPVTGWTVTPLDIEGVPLLAASPEPVLPGPGPVV